jgi:hypothetical protein
MTRLIVTMALYVIPFAMIYGSLELSRAYPAIAVFCAFLAGIVYAAIRIAAIEALIAQEDDAQKGDGE